MVDDLPDFVPLALADALERGQVLELLVLQLSCVQSKPQTSHETFFAVLSTVPVYRRQVYFTAL